MRLENIIKKVILQLGGKIQWKIVQYSNRRKYNKKNNNERLIISMTSWKMRIENVPAVIESILRNTKLPDKIVINLSETEFHNKQDDLPDGLLKLVTNENIEINWVYENQKAFKKIIPTMQKYPNDLILAIDDDYLYPTDFIETFIEAHKKHPNQPLSGNQVRINNTQAHCGCASLTSARFYGKFINDLLDEEIINLGADDVYYTFCAALSGYYYKYVGKTFFLNLEEINPTCALCETGGYDNYKMIHYLNKKIKKMYHLNLNDMKCPLYSFNRR